MLNEVKHLLFLLKKFWLLSSFVALWVVFAGCAASRSGTSAETGVAKVFPWSSGGVKIGYIRSDAIAEKYPDYSDADNTLRSENRGWLAEAEGMEREMRSKETELEELSLILSPQRRQQLEDELVQARKELQQFRHQTWYDDNSTYIKRRKELLEPIDARVNDAIWKVAEEQGIDIVFDTVAGNIVYVKPAFDLTDLVLEELQR